MSIRVLLKQINWSLGALVTLLLLGPGVLLLCTLSYKERYVDITSGRMRTLFYLAGWKASEAISEPTFARIWKEQHGEYVPPVWEEESKLPLLSRRSPHFGFHGAFAWQNAIVVAFETSEFDPDIRAIITSNYVKLLNARAPMKAEEYALAVLELGTRENRARIAKTNAPAWLVTTM